jgi:hypothetical protein
MEKILVIIENVPTFYIEATLNTTIKEIKLTLEDYLNTNRLDINKYTFVFNINPDTQVPVFFTKKYDDVTLESVFNSMKDPTIKISSKEDKNEDLEKRQKFTGNKDIDWVIINSLDDKSLFSLCGTNKYLSSLCDESFWEKRAKERLDDYAIRMKEKDVSWKEYYMKTINNKFNIYQDSRRPGRQLYIGESPIIPADPLIYSHVEKPSRKSKNFYAIIDKKSINLYSKLYTNVSKVKQFYKENLKSYGKLGEVMWITIIVEKWVVENRYK